MTNKTRSPAVTDIVHNQHQTTSNWLHRQTTKLLPVPYYMVTFTLPFQLRGLAKTHPKALYQSMFKVAARLLNDFAATNKQGSLGFTSVLHTHDRRREMHPHLHIIVPSGSYDRINKQWVKGKKGYLFHEFALAKVWRARLLDAINHSTEMTLDIAG